MARVYGIKKRLAQQGMDEKLIKEIIGTGNLVDIITRMEDTLDADTVHSMLDSCGCGGGKEYIKQCEKTGKEIAGRTLEAKITYLNTDTEKLLLNTDGTLTATLSYTDNGEYRCLCSAAVKNGVKVSDLAAVSDGRVMPLTYCFCCAGSMRRHLQLQLGAALRTKEIISSPINSKGEKPCAFVFEFYDNDLSEEKLL
ncbi:MAG: hypothetical protein FWE80_09125 [Oscillospiraceae bacterium]|nr:hypothetical protein [Oscillospiraceae bacterium]